MYGDQPSRWNDALAGDERARFVINVLTRTRFVATSEQEIFNSLRWLGLTWDEGPDVGDGVPDAVAAGLEVGVRATPSSIPFLSQRRTRTGWAVRSWRYCPARIRTGRSKFHTGTGDGSGSWSTIGNSSTISEARRKAGM